jgi:hypothetical protein
VGAVFQKNLELRRPASSIPYLYVWDMKYLGLCGRINLENETFVGLKFQHLMKPVAPIPTNVFDILKRIYFSFYMFRLF